MTTLGNAKMFSLKDKINALEKVEVKKEVKAEKKVEAKKKK